MTKRKKSLLPLNYKVFGKGLNRTVKLQNWEVRKVERVLEYS